MRQVLFSIPDEFYDPLMRVVKALRFPIKTKNVAAPAPKPRKMTPVQQAWVDEFREALHEVELHQQGKIKLKTADQLLDELRAANVE